MKPYIVIVHKDPESAYGMTFPDAPGCFSAADEIDDLFAMATEALELWAEGEIEDGRLMPAPRSLSQIVTDPRWAEAVSSAAFFIALQPPTIALRQAAE
ncbi:MAG: type II toxin-antitoxin system HicB family antitoxin [Beijerinckiaceae bacterium]|mgnify:CR=1 FL=1